jgi:LuxR family transcriptional regulator, maltose regulon positive regulatory protein
MSAGRTADLTPREYEAARIAASGNSNRQVAEKMNTTEGTVKQYLNRVYDKTGCGDRAKLVYVLKEPPK